MWKFVQERVIIREFWNQIHLPCVSKQRDVRGTEIHRHTHTHIWDGLNFLVNKWKPCFHKFSAWQYQHPTTIWYYLVIQTNYISQSRYSIMCTVQCLHIKIHRYWSLMQVSYGRLKTFCAGHVKLYLSTKPILYMVVK